MSGEDKADDSQGPDLRLVPPLESEDEYSHLPDPFSREKFSDVVKQAGDPWRPGGILDPNSVPRLVPPQTPDITADEKLSRAKMKEKFKVIK